VLEIVPGAFDGPTNVLETLQEPFSVRGHFTEGIASGREVLSEVLSKRFQDVLEIVASLLCGAEKNLGFEQLG